ncbi:MAG: shikimate kinase, partial [Actinobacteria bacterium]
MEALTAPGPERASRRGGRSALVFIGFMGAGKSTAARAVARALGERAHDADLELERALGEPIESFFDRAGEEEFRRREEELVLDLLARPDVRVAALGGGALGSIRVRDALRAHVVVHLEVDREVAWRRASGRGRPLARDRAKFEALHASRLPVYEAAADATLPAADKALAARA